MSMLPSTMPPDEPAGFTSHSPSGPTQKPYGRKRGFKDGKPEVSRLKIGLLFPEGNLGNVNLPVFTEYISVISYDKRGGKAVAAVFFKDRGNNCNILL